jgi:hypothetical protein
VMAARAAGRQRGCHRQNGSPISGKRPRGTLRKNTREESS